jgi:hypothetical protein
VIYNDYNDIMAYESLVSRRWLPAWVEAPKQEQTPEERIAEFIEQATYAALADIHYDALRLKREHEARWWLLMQRRYFPRGISRPLGFIIPMQPSGVYAACIGAGGGGGAASFNAEHQCGTAFEFHPFHFNCRCATHVHSGVQGATTGPAL